MESITLENQQVDSSLSRIQLFILALCAGTAVANLYYSQPLLAMIAETFNAPASVALVTTATQVGYALGILFILPLGDLLERRRLTVGLSVLLVLASFACALADSLTMLMVTSCLLGFAAIITQILVPLAADLAPPEKRAHAVGVVFSGVLAGILLARVLSGIVGETFGWRAMFVVAGISALLLGLTLSLSLPKLAAKSSQRYRDLLGSMFVLLKQHRKLRVACAIQACLFAIFSAFWCVLALLLAEPPFQLGATVAGAFGVIGLVGVAAANLSGRLTERYGTKRVLFLGVVCCVAAYAIFAVDLSITALILGVIILDFGLSIANVANQSMILGLDEQARSRINTIYVTAIFIGGALGSAVASAAWNYSGWSAVCTFGFIVALLALAIHLYSGVAAQGQTNC